MVGDQDSSAAKGFYFPSKIIPCLNIAYAGRKKKGSDTLSFVPSSGGESNDQQKR